MQDMNTDQSSVQIHSWNTWTLRAILKAAAGLCFAGVALPLVFMLAGGTNILYQNGALLAFTSGVILWSIFYYLEVEYRRAHPDRIR